MDLKHKNVTFLSINIILITLLTLQESYMYLQTQTLKLI